MAIHEVEAGDSVHVEVAATAGGGQEFLFRDHIRHLWPVPGAFRDVHNAEQQDVLRCAVRLLEATFPADTHDTVAAVVLVRHLCTDEGLHVDDGGLVHRRRRVVRHELLGARGHVAVAPHVGLVGEDAVGRAARHAQPGATDLDRRVHGQRLGVEQHICYATLPRNPHVLHPQLAHGRVAALCHGWRDRGERDGCRVAPVHVRATDVVVEVEHRAANPPHEAGLVHVVPRRRVVRDGVAEHADTATGVRDGSGRHADVSSRSHVFGSAADTDGRRQALHPRQVRAGQAGARGIHQRRQVDRQSRDSTLQLHLHAGLRRRRGARELDGTPADRHAAARHALLGARHQAHVPHAPARGVVDGVRGGAQRQRAEAAEHGATAGRAEDGATGGVANGEGGALDGQPLARAGELSRLRIGVDTELHAGPGTLSRAPLAASDDTRTAAAPHIELHGVGLGGQVRDGRGIDVDDEGHRSGVARGAAEVGLEQREAAVLAGRRREATRDAVTGRRDLSPRRAHEHDVIGRRGRA